MIARGGDLDNFRVHDQRADNGKNSVVKLRMVNAGVLLAGAAFEKGDEIVPQGFNVHVVLFLKLALA
jgi:hypothetical protein